ncbi:MAG: hypothetical protein P4L84_07065 [Isosphaeraceae bacterium]|nr:hypothetical protein [Isosphaeraceae bacterium]
MDIAWVGLIGVIAGTVLGAGLQEWRAKNDESRAVRQHRRQRTADYNLARLTETRMVIAIEADYFLAWAVASDAEVERAADVRRATRTGLSDTTLVGDDQAVKRWIAIREEVVQRGRLKGQDLALVQEIYDARDGCFDGIDEQIRRAMNDEPLVALGSDARAAISRAMIARHEGGLFSSPDK